MTEKTAEPRQAAESAATAPTAAPAAASPPASAPASAPGSAPASAAAQVEAKAEPRRPMFGAEIDAGLPEGFGASLIFRPWYFIRLHAGGVTNVASGGIRGGLTLIPFHWYVTPTFGTEVGHLFEGNMNGTLSSFLTGSKLPAGTLDRVSYTYYSAHLGLEFGAPDRFIVYLRGGLSRVEAVAQGPKQVNGTTTVDPGAVNLAITIPSAKIGLLLYF
ncbi:MAG: hypothetical protein QM765_08090 [Myxococcales bacterium]